MQYKFTVECDENKVSATPLWNLRVGTMFIYYGVDSPSLFVLLEKEEISSIRFVKVAKIATGEIFNETWETKVLICIVKSSNFY